MVLTPGTRVGPYEITAQIGVGGMGEVYRATDTNLKRAVAIKVLPESVAADAERLARFQREAEVLASLNHPHIAAIYGLERSVGITALVMELVEGPTLADRIALGPIPVDEALPTARQIAAALEAAHGQLTIHRDLKPANVKVRPDGTVKVLDFGLAKALEPIGTLSPSASMSPTITSPAMTHAGTILGTAAYMSPEQARGKPLDKGTDVWSFGCVLFEMLTGTRAFAGEDVSDTLAAVLRGEPEWSAIPPDVPAVVRTLIRRCLEKDRQQRIGDMSVVLFVLNEPTILEPTAIGKTSTMPKPTIWQRMALPVVAVLASAILTGISVWFATHSSIAQPSVTRLLITPPSGAAPTISSLTIAGAANRHIAITADGRRVVYVGANGTTLFVRPLDQLDAIPLAGLGAPTTPFLSPDGQWIGFADQANLKKVAITGGPPVVLASLGNTFRGATWAPDDTIVFATADTSVGLQQMPAGGGEPTVLTRPDRARGEADHFWPEFLPGGHAVLFTIMATTGGLDQAQVAVLDLLTMKQTILIPGGSDAHYVPSGHLVYGAAGTLRAVAFDLAGLAVVGAGISLLPQVVTTAGGAVDVAVASDGTLVYVPGVATATARTLVWVDRQSQETPIPAPPRTYDQPRISPDGGRVAVHAADQEGDIWLWDLLRGTFPRVTSHPTQDNYPVWTKDGQIVFSSTRGGVQNLFMQAANGTGDVTRLTESPNAQRVTSLSPDGNELVFYENKGGADWDLMQLRLDRPGEIKTLVQTPFVERNGEISPDGHWLAYEANNSGRFEIYVVPFPDGTRERSTVSTTGGRQPLWARDSRELFYLTQTGALMQVDVGRGVTWSASVPKKVLESRYYVGTDAQVARMYDVDLDGKRFLMIKPSDGAESDGVPTSLVVVQHFDEDLKRLVPLSK